MHIVESIAREKGVLRKIISHMAGTFNVRVIYHSEEVIVLAMFEWIQSTIYQYFDLLNNLLDEHNLLASPEEKARKMSRKIEKTNRRVCSKTGKN